MANRVIVISGGSKGLGLALVRRLLELGDSVVTFSRTPTDAIGKLEQAPETAGRLLYRAVDAVDTGQVGELVREVGSRFGRLDGLINNAGIARDGVLAMMSDQAIRQLIDVNLTAALTLTRECIRLMLAPRAGPPAGTESGQRIVNVASIIGLRGYAGLAAYSATKAGLIGMTASLARELGPRRITVNAVAPGYLETEMTGELTDSQKAQIVRRTPLGRLGTPADVVAAVEFLLSPQAGFITGQTIMIDGGLSC